ELGPPMITLFGGERRAANSVAPVLLALGQDEDEMRAPRQLRVPQGIERRQRTAKGQAPPDLEQGLRLFALQMAVDVGVANLEIHAPCLVAAILATNAFQSVEERRKAIPAAWSGSFRHRNRPPGLRSG